MLHSDKKSLDDCTLDNCPAFSLNGLIVHAKVVDVYDGDSIKCAFKWNRLEYTVFTIRMNGYDSPEMRPSRRLPAEVREQIKAKAAAARDYLAGLILNKIVVLHCHDFDKYGRVLATVFLNGINVNKKMVYMDHGYNYRGGTKRDPSELVSLEELPE